MQPTRSSGKVMVMFGTSWLAPTAPQPDQLNVAVETMRRVTPKQKRLLNKLRNLAEQLEQRDFAALDKDTLIGNIATARRVKAGVRYYNSEFDEECNEAFDTLYAAVRTHVLSLLECPKRGNGNDPRCLRSSRHAAQASGSCHEF